MYDDDDALLSSAAGAVKINRFSLAQQQQGTTKYID